MKADRQVLVCVLDWGLGHATRSAVIIKDLQALEYTPVLAAHGAAFFWLKENFPELKIIEKPGYEVSYSKEIPFFIDVFRQLPKLFSRIKEEKKWLDELLQKHPFCAIISDNCYGCYHQTIPSFIITHQTQLPIKGLAGKMAQKQVNKALAPFDAVLIPDVAGDHNFAGVLSHHQLKKVHYLGALSRLEGNNSGIYPEKSFTVCALVSGPEPERGHFERALYASLQDIPGKHLFFTGSRSPIHKSTEQIQCFALNESGRIHEALQQSEIIITRAGYSSLMDLASLKQKAILIPTPGQKEQEYLAEFWAENYGFTWVKALENLHTEIQTQLYRPVDASLLPENISIKERQGIIAKLLGQ